MGSDLELAGEVEETKKNVQAITEIKINADLSKGWADFFVCGVGVVVFNAPMMIPKVPTILFAAFVSTSWGQRAIPEDNLAYPILVQIDLGNNRSGTGSGFQYRHGT